MHEIEKIKEAEYFYNQMLRTEDDSNVFKYNLSAFLAAARSVLQFALYDVDPKPNDGVYKVKSPKPTPKPGGKYWYDLCMKDPVLKFFRDTRNVNIHIEPVDVRKDIQALFTENIFISDSITVVLKDEHGNVSGESKSETALPKGKEEIPPVVTYKYKFDDWPGNEDVFALCQRYLAELKIVVTDGQKKGFLS